MNLLPANPGKTPGYWCTWWLQNVLAAEAQRSNSFGFSGHSLIARALTEDMINRKVYETDFLSKARADMYMVFDLGWDVPGDVEFDKANWLLGSMETAQDKFPSFTGAPAERLRQLNEWTKRAGWRGAGLWIPAHAYGERRDGDIWGEDHLKEFFRERLAWSREAGIEYWKVDYGFHAGDLAFRRMLTELGRKEATRLWIEHARNGGPFNDEICPWDTDEISHSGRFAAWGGGKILEASVETVSFSDVFRTYDVSFTLSKPTTLDRVAELLAAYSGHADAGCILQCESEPYIGAALGCAIGSMSSPTEQASAWQPFERAFRWQRIAPAWGVGLSENVLDDQVLTDTWDFRPGSDWVDFTGGSVIRQAVPARVARGMELPEVEEDGEPPFVVCSRHPNGAVAVAALPRVSVEKGIYFPRARITASVGQGDSPIALLGQFGQAALRFDGPVPEGTVWAQDLREDTAVDISGEVRIDGRMLIVPGALIDRICGMDGKPTDQPGIILQIRRGEV